MWVVACYEQSPSVKNQWDRIKFNISSRTCNAEYEYEFEILPLNHFFSLSLVIHSTSSVPPRITPFNFGDDIQEGMRVQTMCTSTQGDQPFNITWYRDSKALRGGDQTDSATSNQHRHHFDERTIEINSIQSFSSILTIHNITSQHNGNFTCQISNPAGVVVYTVALSVAGKYRSCLWLFL